MSEITATNSVLDTDRQARLNERLVAIDRIAGALSSGGDGLTTAELAEELELPFRIAQRAVTDLVVAGRIAKACSRDGRPAYRLATGRMGA